MASVGAILRALRADPHHADSARLLRRVWELLEQCDEEVDDTALGGVTGAEVGADLRWIASKLSVAQCAEWLSSASGMVELVFTHACRSAAMERAARVAWLGEEAVHDPEYALWRAQAGVGLLAPHFVSYVACVLATCAGVPAVQRKAVGRVIALSLDAAVWTACPEGLTEALVTVGAMANPRTSYRDEFFRAGGLACVALAYIETEEPQHAAALAQVLRGVTARDLQQHVDADGLRQLTRALVSQVCDWDAEDRHGVAPALFACMYDTRLWHEHVAQWACEAWWRKDCPSAFLRFCLARAPELRRLWPHLARAATGCVLLHAWLRDAALRRRYQWAAYPETKRAHLRLLRGPEQHIAEAEAAQAALGHEAVPWTEALAAAGAIPDACAVCGVRGGKLQRCGRCKWRSYCGPACQARDWTQQHKGSCGM